MEPSEKHIHVGQAHGTLATLTWGLVMPVGAILIRTVPSKRAWLLHASVMLFGLAMFTSAFGLGLFELYDFHAPVAKIPHAIIGVVVFSLAWLQPFSGLTHHWQYRTSGRRVLVTVIHIFFGRVLILLGVINGGLGIMLNPDVPMWPKFVYGVLAGIVAFLFLGGTLFFEAKREMAHRSLPPSEKKGEDLSLRSHSADGEQTL